MPSNRHAVLSASSSHRWLHCNPSARLELEFEERETEAAAEGTAAHALAEHKLRKVLKMRSTRPVSKYDSDEMEMYTDSYLEFVLEAIEEARQDCPDPKVLIEQRLDFSCYVPDGFGGFVRLQEEEALLERALFKLTCRRGAFPFLPELGSRLRELGRLRPSARNAAAQQYAAQALEGMGLEVTGARVRMVSDDQADVAIELVYDGAQRTVEVTV